MDYGRLYEVCDRVPVLRDLDGMAPGLRALPKKDWERHNQVWETARSFARSEVYPRALSTEERMHDDPWAVEPEFLKAAGRAGLFSINCFRSLGGAGLGGTACGLVLEELCAGCAGLGNLVGAHGLGLIGLLFTRNLALSRRIQLEIAEGEKRGEPVVLACAVTEPEAGSDVEDIEHMKTARIGTSATKVPGGFLLSGTKIFISNGSFADYVVIAAAFDRKRPRETWSMFLVDAKSPGFSVARVEAKMGMKANPAAELHLEEVFVPDDCMVSDRVGDGMEATEVVLGASRGPVAAIATGIARGALERFLYYATVTEHAGRPLIEHAFVRDIVAESLEEIGICRSAWLNATLSFDRMGVGALATSVVPELYRLPGASWVSLSISRSTRRRTWLADRFDQQFSESSETVLAHASLAKRMCSESALKIVTRLMGVMGPAALDPSWGMEKIWRDAKLTQIYEGTNQLNRLCFYDKGVTL